MRAPPPPRAPNAVDLRVAARQRLHRCWMPASLVLHAAWPTPDTSPGYCHRFADDAVVKAKERLKSRTAAPKPPPKPELEDWMVTHKVGSLSDAHAQKDLLYLRGTVRSTKRMKERLNLPRRYAEKGSLFLVAGAVEILA